MKLLKLFLRLFFRKQKNIKKSKLITPMIIGIKIEDNKRYLSADKIDHLELVLDSPLEFEIHNIIITINKVDYQYLTDEIELAYSKILRIIIKKSVDLMDNVNKVVKFSVKSITYVITKKSNITINFTDIKEDFYFVKSSTIKNIETPAQLQNMENGYIYQLSNNIDLEGYSWTPYNFFGILNGNGFHISNISIVINNVTSNSHFFGLFNIFNGLIYELGLVNYDISIITRGYVIVGGFAGSGGSISNCYASGVRIKVHTLEFALVGGLIGGNGNIDNCHLIDFNISIKSESCKVGGLSGSNCNFFNSYVQDGDIKIQTLKNATVGGLVGSSSRILRNSYVRGINIEVFEADYVNIGGLVGMTSNDISNCFVENSILSIHCYETSSTSMVGGLVGTFFYNRVINCHVHKTRISIYSKKAYVSGLIGYSAIGNIENCYVEDVIIMLTSKKSGVIGGLLGMTGNIEDYHDQSPMYGEGIVINSYAINIEIHASTKDIFSGGIVGRNSQNTIKNSFVYGISMDLYASESANVGGIVGINYNFKHSKFIYSSRTEGVVSCLVCKSFIKVDSPETKYVKRVIGFNLSGGIGENYITNDNDVLINNMKQDKDMIEKTIEIEMLEDIRFYLKKLSWNETIWDFSYLNYQNGKMPKHK